MNLKEGDVFYTEDGTFRIVNGAPTKEPAIKGNFGVETVRLGQLKKCEGKECLIIGKIDPVQPRNDSVRLTVAKSKKKSDGEIAQPILLDVSTLVEIFDKTESISFSDEEDIDAQE